MVSVDTFDREEEEWQNQVWLNSNTSNLWHMVKMVLCYQILEHIATPRTQIPFHLEAY